MTQHLFPTQLETERLELERLARDTVDVGDYYEHCSYHEPDIETVTKYLPWDPHQTVGDTVEYLKSLEEQWAAGERAEYVIRPKPGEDGAGEIAGSAGLIIDWDADLAKLAIWLRRRFWGRGYSGERAGALLRLAFDRLDLSVVAIPLVAENEKSYRAVEKYVDDYGGEYEGRLRNHAGRYDPPRDHHRFTISQAEYQTTVSKE